MGCGRVAGVVVKGPRHETIQAERWSGAMVCVVKVAIDTRGLHVASDDEARRAFEELLGRGDAWVSELMQYRTTSGWQDDWVVEVGNWLIRARQLGFLDRLLAPVLPQRAAAGSRAAGDPVHRNVHQQLAQAMVVHYFVGTGWALRAFEPNVTDLRGDGTRADVDVQMSPMGTTTIVDMQVKGSGTLGVEDREADAQILGGVAKAAAQLPDPPVGPALIVMVAQRGWPLYGDTHVLETLIGTSGYPDRRVLLHDQARGQLESWTHISGLVILDHRRGLEDADYGCAVLQNPWAEYPVDPAWFPHARVLTCVDGLFTWLRSAPSVTKFPTGTRFAPGAPGDALRG